jgi:dTDP-4-dehydrorhamnose 3,5-epimerase
LSEVAEVLYKCDEFYHPEADGGIHYQSVDIDWRVPSDKLILSEKDKNLPSIHAAKISF